MLERSHPAGSESHPRGLSLDKTSGHEELEHVGRNRHRTDSMFVWSSEIPQPQQIIKSDQALPVAMLSCQYVAIRVSARPRAERVDDMCCCHVVPRAALISRSLCDR
jgi:hypothetical protein